MLRQTEIKITSLLLYFLNIEYEILYQILFTRFYYIYWTESLLKTLATAIQYSTLYILMVLISCCFYSR